MTTAWPHRLDGTAYRGNKSVNALRVLLRIGPDSDEPACAVELLERTPLDQLEEEVRDLKVLRPADEVRKAMVERIARAPLGDFETLKHIYLKHCGGTPK
jgi:hypothetical protein